MRNDFKTKKLGSMEVGHTTIVKFEKTKIFITFGCYLLMQHKTEGFPSHVTHTKEKSKKNTEAHSTEYHSLSPNVM